MATLYTHRAANISKTWALMTGFLVFIVGVGFVFSQAYGDPAILWVAVIFSLVMNVASYWFSDSIALRMSGARPANKEEYFELFTTVENLAITAGLPMPRVYIIDDVSPNAFATGRDPEHAAVAVTTGILRILNKTELEGVLAHELSHIGNRDILVSTIAVVLAGTIAMISDMAMRMAFFGGGRDREGKGNGIMLVIALALAVLAPIAATMIQLAISRKREFLADASGALLTRYPEGLASALEKISASSMPMANANHATAHLWIANPFKGDSARSVMTKMFMTHPPIEERIAILRDMDVGR
ncbi:MAG TPA: zinc metalloprotease HtpX [Candidatus Paceibacterota bacterium]|nr:zinc metalloprotease HtpX [Candidatus Paceibacterota bacterium]